MGKRDSRLIKTSKETQVYHNQGKFTTTEKSVNLSLAIFFLLSNCCFFSSFHICLFGKRNVSQDFYQRYRNLDSIQRFCVSPQSWLLKDIHRRLRLPLTQTSRVTIGTISCDTFFLLVVIKALTCLCCDSVCKYFFFFISLLTIIFHWRKNKYPTNFQIFSLITYSRLKLPSNFIMNLLSSSYIMHLKAIDFALSRNKKSFYSNYYWLRFTGIAKNLRLPDAKWWCNSLLTSTAFHKFMKILASFIENVRRNIYKWIERESYLEATLKKVT